MQLRHVTTAINLLKTPIFNNFPASLLFRSLNALRSIVAMTHNVEPYAMAHNVTLRTDNVMSKSKNNILQIFCYCKCSFSHLGFWSGNFFLIATFQPMGIFGFSFQ